MYTQEKSFTLGRTVAEANSFDTKDHRVLVSTSFMTGGYLTDPNGDIYLSRMAAADLGKGEDGLVARLQPGVLAYYHEVGLIPDESQVHEVDPVTNLCDKTGYPYSDPLYAAREQEMRFDGQLYVGILPTAETAQWAKDVGLTHVQQSNAFKTNNKVRFGQHAREYGYEVLPYEVITPESDLNDIAFMTAWLKGQGSGGDLVHKVENASDPEHMRQAIDHMRAAYALAFTTSSLGELDSFWPHGQIAPNGTPLLLEQHAADFGRILLNGSNVVYVDRQSHKVINRYQQLTDQDGNYLGSTPLPADYDTTLLDRDIPAIAQYCRSLNLFGIVGVDFMHIQGQDKELLYNVELNGRVPISGLAQRLANKVDAPFWLNANIWNQQGTINDMDEYRAAVGGKFVDRHSSGRVIPHALRAEWRAGDQLVQESNAAKVLITGESQEEINSIVAELQSQGLSFS